MDLIRRLFLSMAGTIGLIFFIESIIFFIFSLFTQGSSSLALLWFYFWPILTPIVGFIVFGMVFWFIFKFIVK